jgi:hypothetical protein
MKGDFSRRTFDPARHYSGVRMQQGRVQLDADWNEQVDLARHRVETETVDTVGHCGGPLHDAGFRIIPLPTAPAGIKSAIAAAYPGVNVNTANELVILPGRYYVDGVLAVCERPVLFGRQPDFPHLPVPATHGLEVGTHLLYLDVWERHLTALNDPLLREVALGGPDTATRTRTVWQVKAWKMSGSPVGCPPAPEWEAEMTPPERRMRARARPAGPDLGPCVVPAGALYTGLENQLYRVEVHAPGAADVPPANPATAGFSVTADPNDARVVVAAGGTWNVGDTVLLFPTAAAPRLRPTLAQVAARSGPNNRTLTLTARFAMDAGDGARIRAIPGATCKWSRDNGIAVTRVTGFDNADLARVVVESLGPDEVLGFRSGDWVELSGDVRELGGAPGLLAMVERVETAAGVVVLRTPFPGLAAADLGTMGNPTLRRWDGFVPVGPGPEPQGYRGLEDGVEVAFTGGPFRTGDHWLIPARTATANAQGGTVEWPEESVGQGKALPPLGIHHHVCRLATVSVAPASASVVADCRCLFAPLSELRALAYVSGAGQEAMPDHSGLDPKPKPELGLPLVVGIGNGHCAAGARVRFQVKIGGGDVSNQQGSYPAGGQTQVDVDVGVDGTASCWWRLGRDVQDQTVSATLLEKVDEAADVWLPVNGAVVFNASLSVASRVAYLPIAGCTPLADQDTVQSAIDRVLQLVRVYPAGGDGQEARPGQEAPCPLRVRVASTCGPVAGRQVRFTAAGGGMLRVGAGAPAATVEVNSGADGIAQVTAWRLGTSGCQSVTAALLPVVDGIPLAEPREAVFTATLSVASEVEYRPASDCSMPTSGPGAVDTVQEALDWLCRNHGGGCEVTVGQGGDFRTLAEAFARLFPERRAICICLLPGVHQVTEPLVLARDDGTVKITACGPGTRIVFRRGVTVRGLESFILRDVDVLVDDDGHIQPAAFVFSDTEQIVIENCRIGQGGQPTTLLQVEKAARVRVSGCTMWSLYAAPQGESAEDADVTGMDRPAALVAKVTKVAKVAGGASGFVEGTQTETLWHASLATLWAGMESKLGLPLDVKAVAPAAPAPWIGADVVRLLDARATVTLQDNLMVGYVRLYGGTGQVLPLQKMGELMRDVAGEKLVVSPGEGDLHLRGCSLLGVRLDAKVLDLRLPATGNARHDTLEGAFRLCVLSETLFALPGSMVVAAQLRVASDHFEMGASADEEKGAYRTFGNIRLPSPHALLGAARSATAVGNVAGNWADNYLIVIAVSNNRGSEAGNNPAVQIF